MNALVMRGHGDLSQLGMAELPTPPPPGDGEVLIALEAAALNRLDLWTLEGLPGLNLSMPHVLGGDGAGVVEAVGPHVTNVRPGDAVLFNPGVSCYSCENCHAGEHSLCVRYRLMGEHLPGTLAEKILVPAPNVYRIPEVSGSPLTWAESAAYSLATLTAWRMLVTRAQVRPGEVVLIWGIGGGVSSVAVSIAKLMGAFVIATSSSRKKLAIATEMGANATLDHTAVDVAREVRKFTGKRGADVVLDNVGEATWEQSLKALSKAGRLVTCGGTTGPMVVTDVRRLFWNQYTIMGSTMGNAAEYREIIRLLGQGALRPRVDLIVPLEQGVRAFERVASGAQMGKTVVDICGRAGKRAL